MDNIRMETKNADGVRIEKSVPENLVSQYEILGWKKVEKKKDFKEDKEDNKSSQNSLNK